ncbi:MAG: hypothetical protein HZB38_18835 [Planctomycetes bacterium]|nr:hypothetical protein [Planctomycetota bacterium]
MGRFSGLFLTFAVCAARASAAVWTFADVLDPSDAEVSHFPPADVLCVDIFVDVSNGDVWTVGGVHVEALNGAALRYATDPNTSLPILTNPGVENRFVTSFSKPRGRDADARFANSGAASAGAYCPPGPDVEAGASVCSVAFFASPPETSTSPSVDGYVFRVAVELSGRPSNDPYALFLGTPPDPTHPDVILISQCPHAAGTVNHGWGPETVGGIDWYVQQIPEPSTVALVVVLLAVGRRWRGAVS